MAAVSWSESSPPHTSRALAGDQSLRKTGDGGRVHHLPQPGLHGGSRWRSGRSRGQGVDASACPDLPMDRGRVNRRVHHQHQDYRVSSGLLQAPPPPTAQGHVTPTRAGTLHHQPLRPVHSLFRLLGCPGWGPPRPGRGCVGGDITESAATDSGGGGAAISSEQLCLPPPIPACTLGAAPQPAAAEDAGGGGRSTQGSAARLQRQAQVS